MHRVRKSSLRRVNQLLKRQAGRSVNRGKNVTYGPTKTIKMVRDGREIRVRIRIDGHRVMLFDMRGKTFAWFIASKPDLADPLNREVIKGITAGYENYVYNERRKRANDEQRGIHQD